ncbi:MAG: GYDIA family GHMP kinase [Saprospiraceae bacterium]
MSVLFEARANGKLLISAEYLVLRGALALALPTRLGQSLRVSACAESPGRLLWRAYDHVGALWMEADFELLDMRLARQSGASAERLHAMLSCARGQMSGWLDPQLGYLAETRLDFPGDWGLGSSSTLTALLARWSGVDPYALLEVGFGGSGYDVACAFAEGPILYRLESAGRSVRPAPEFAPPFRDHLLFVFLGRKQDSRAAMEHFNAVAPADLTSLVRQAEALTLRACLARTLAEFEAWMVEHEQLLSRVLGIRALKERLFPEFPGALKSLGGWGGDFALATAKDPDAARRYFAEKNLFQVFGWDELIYATASG